MGRGKKKPGGSLTTGHVRSPNGGARKITVRVFR